MSVFPLKRRQVGEPIKRSLFATVKNVIGITPEGNIVGSVPSCFTRLDTKKGSYVDNWKNIYSILGADELSMFGLKKDGTCLTYYAYSFPDTETGTAVIASRTRIASNKYLVSVDCPVNPTNTNSQWLAAVKKDGTCIKSSKRPAGNSSELGRYVSLSEWKNIITICVVDYELAAGLKADGTVIASGYSSTLNAVNPIIETWSDIVDIAGKFNSKFLVGLKADGTVVCTQDIPSLSSWENIIAIASSGGTVVGLKDDGTVVATGDNSNGQCNVQEWTNIIAISCYSTYTVGLKIDGTVVGTENTPGLANLSNMRLLTYDNKGLAITKKPVNLLDKTSVKGFTIKGIEPVDTNRRVAFKVDDVWNKIQSDGKLSPLAMQKITANSILSEGNTVAELEAVTDVPAFAGKLVYPAVALYASEEAEVMPTFGMTIKAEIDTTVNVYSYTAYSQEYAISDGTDVPIVSVVAETETTGNGKVDITARIKENGEWSDYMPLNSVQMKTASGIQLKALYTVQSTDGRDSAKIKDVIIKYNTGGAVTSNSTTDIVTVTERFTNDLTYVHAYIKHKELNDAKIKVYCSLRKTPSKRIMYQFGNGTGALKTFKLPDAGINQDTLLIYVDGRIAYDFGYNTETSEVTISADKDTVLSASYEYGWEKSEWIEMEQGVSQVNDSGAYTTEYAYTVPKHDGEYTVTAIKYELLRPEGHVDNEIIGVGTGKRQIIQLPHFARKETIVCNGKWSYDYDSKRLTIIAPEGEDIAISYDWIAESPQVYGVMAGWAD